MSGIPSEPGASGSSPTPPPESTAGFALWTFFTVAVGIALTLDLAYGSASSSHARNGRDQFRSVLLSSIAWLGLGLSFALFLFVTKGSEVGLVFLTGYLVEKSLSVDNLIVIALIFNSFRIKPSLQGPVLKWGIFGAVVFRTVFIFAGVALLEHFASAVYIFGALLLWSAYKMWTDDDDDEDEMYAEAHKKGNSWMMRTMQLFVPYHAEAKGNRFLERIDGRWHATPMLASLVVVELSDLIFAVDSIPCILGLTHDLFLVFSSNMLAILGLRSLYLLLAEALDRVQNLKKGLAGVLAFVGLKMALGEYFPLPQGVCLLIIFGILGVTFAMGIKGESAGKSHKPNRNSNEMFLPL